jgi:hypothetical protein
VSRLRAMAPATRLACAAAWLFAAAGPAPAAPLRTDELATVCAQAEGPAHCGRLVEAVQLRRLPNLATRDGATLKVNMYPAGVATFADTEARNGGRSYSLWDSLDPINAVLLYTTDGDTVTFTLVQRGNGRRTELPTEPLLSPDRQHLVTADFCPRRCVNEVAVWRVTKDGVHKELVWTPRETWIDAGARWKTAETLVLDYTPADDAKAGVVERRLADPTWQHLTPP